MALVDFAFDPLPGPVLHRTLAELRTESPLAPTLFFGGPAWVIARHEVLAEAFRSRAIERYERAELAALAHEIVDAIDVDHEIDLVTSFAERFPYLVITRMLGLPHDREEEFHTWALGLLRYTQDRENARRCAEEFTRYLAPVVEDRRRAPREDVIGELVHAEVEGRRLIDEEVYSHVRLLFPTGGETTHGALGNLLYALLSHEGLWEELRRAPERIPGAVEEALRWETSVAVLPRLSAPEPMVFHNVELPANSWVLFAIAGANRDPAVFSDPDRFDPMIAGSCPPW